MIERASCSLGFQSRALGIGIPSCFSLALLLFFPIAASADEAPPAPPLVEQPLTDADFQHWSFRPLAHPSLPSVKNSAWCVTSVDRFILAAQERRELGPLPPADKIVLLRRVTFDLTGLPPLPDEVDEFLADVAPDAYERKLDRLLAAPAYGERQAQHWLDLARFAETDGFEHDLPRPNAWRYRDWVIDALNADMPYDEFVRRQIAGDLLHAADPSAAIATGFLLCGPDMPDINSQDERRHSVLNEMAATVGTVFLGLQFGCAACHDHKFDPVSQADFYRLRAFFNSVDMFHDHPVPTADQLVTRQRAEQARGPVVRRVETTRRELEDAARQRLREKNPDLQPKLDELQAEMSPDDRAQHMRLTTELATYKKLPDVPLGRVVQRGPPRDSFVMLRGDFRQPGPPVRAGFPRIANPPGHKTAEFGATATSPDDRAGLARWLTQSDAPLFRRVMVNRIWQQQFGRGLVATASDFGLLGDSPSHLDLMDWLATEWPRQDGCLKWLCRTLATSATYRQASRPPSEGSTDKELRATRAVWLQARREFPHNQWLVGMSRRRLDGESLRDALLTVADRLDREPRGTGVRPPLPPELVSTLLKNQWDVSPATRDHYRRSIYLFVRRNLRYPLLDVFDRPDTNATCPQRTHSTTAPQALALLNSELAQSTAHDLAHYVANQTDVTPAAQVELACRRTLSRPPTATEIDMALKFLTAQSKVLADHQPAWSPTPSPADKTPPEPYSTQALADLCLALINLNEFLYID